MRSISPAKIEGKADVVPNGAHSGFYIGQKVKVVAGTQDPDYGGPIGGRSGIVEEVIVNDDSTEPKLYCIQWDRATLKAMGRAHHKRCEKDNLDVEKMVLAEHELDAS
jgi:hypothetical protein